MEIGNWFLNNREIIKNLSLNTGTSQLPVMTSMCTTSEIGLVTDFEQQDFYVFCDAIKRALMTGVSISLNTTVKLDINNTAIQGLLAKIHTLLTTGEIAQFNNELVQFELLEKVSEDVLTYKKYKAPATLKFSDLGGSAEDVSEFSLEIIIVGKATVAE